MRKRIIALVLTIVMLLSVCPASFALNYEKPTYIDNTLELMQFCHIASHGPVSIVKAKLYRSIIPETVYLIYLHGTTLGFGKLNNLAASLSSGLSLDSRYLRTLKSAAKEQIPFGAKVILAGHSLGGMIAQQFAADTEMKLRYNILNILACGSPCVLTGTREGALHRLADCNDIVPYTTPLPTRNFTYCLQKEDGGYPFPLSSSIPSMS